MGAWQKLFGSSKMKVRKPSLTFHPFIKNWYRFYGFKKYFFSSETRENALLELSRKRESVESLAPMLWHSFGTISGIDFRILESIQKKTQWGVSRIRSKSQINVWFSNTTEFLTLKILSKALLQEIVSVYYAIDPPTLSAMQSNRVCNALALLQCVASHPDTRQSFLQAHIPLFLYPFLNTSR